MKKSNDFKNIFNFKSEIYLPALFIIIVFITILLIFPGQLFDNKYSTILNDRNGRLLGAKIADDGQWRFPEPDSVPYKFKTSLLQFEDEYFYYHPGFNPLSLVRALYQNIKAGRVVSGGSTITMQLVRISRKGKSRTVIEKIIEIILSVAVELKYSKEEILVMYSAHAPFGGNTVGVESASWRYFGRPVNTLSWAEAASLAVLPNEPGLVFPGRNQKKFKVKRDKLLDKLMHNGIIDEIENKLAKTETVPGRPGKLPSIAPHLLARAVKEGMKGKRVNSTIDIGYQGRVNDILRMHGDILAGNEIHNAAAIVIETKTGKVTAYTGNLPPDKNNLHSRFVDVITSPRSTGSILKPFLYSAMLSDGLILPNTLLRDVPTFINGFTPENFTESYDGAVPASEALYRSLNIPAVHLLKDYSVAKFHKLLRKLGFTTITEGPDHYGLSLILGGAEATLWDLASVYAMMGRVLGNYHTYGTDHYSPQDFHYAFYNPENGGKNLDIGENFIIDAASIFYVFEALTQAYRPETELSWERFTSSSKIAWKTGTSFGFRDAWAIGVTPDYTVGVWVGNADGEGRPGLVGLKAAAPILFDILNILPPSDWFEEPYDETVKVPVCLNSGHRATETCPLVDSVRIPLAGLKSPPCPYCRLIHLDQSRKYRVNADCEDIDKIINEKWFVLPPVMEWYYKRKNSTYRILPPFRKGCDDSEGSNPVQIIYPLNGSQIYIPKELGGETGKVVFKAAHREPATTIFWNIDETFVGQTKRIHHLELSPKPGKHKLTVTDENGNTRVIYFEIVSG